MKCSWHLIGMLSCLEGVWLGGWTISYMCTPVECLCGVFGGQGPAGPPNVRMSELGKDVNCTANSFNRLFMGRACLLASLQHGHPEVWHCSLHPFCGWGATHTLGTLAQCISACWVPEVWGTCRALVRLLADPSAIVAAWWGSSATGGLCVQLRCYLQW